MKFALVGYDAEAAELLRQLLASGPARHELVVACDVGNKTDDIQKLAPLVDLNSEWENLLGRDDLDFAIIAAHKLDISRQTGISASGRRFDQLGKLAQAALPLLIFQPACEAIEGFEIEMIRRDQKGVIVPFVPGLVPEAINKVVELAAGTDSRLGKIEQVVLERQMQDRSRDAVLTQFARDLAILRPLLGMITRVAASGPAGVALRDPMATAVKIALPLHNLSVHLSGESPFAARWNVGPVETEAGGRLLLLGTSGKAILQIPADQAAPWELEIVGSPGERCQFSVPSPATQLPLEFAAAQIAVASLAATPSAWLLACRDAEAMGAIDRSLQRGRAIELFNEEHSETGTFKGMMSAGGCLMLVAGLMLTVLVAMLGALYPASKSSALVKLWPWLLAGPMVLFMLLQLLLGLTKKNKDAK